jgi:hypothetical protein
MLLYVCIYRDVYIHIHRDDFYLLDEFTALLFTAADAPLAARCIRILPTNQHAWRPISFGMKQLKSQITWDVENSVLFTRRYFSKLIVLLKSQVQQSFLHLQHTRHQLSLDGAGLLVLDVDSVNSSSDYFANLCTSGLKPCFITKEC